MKKFFIGLVAFIAIAVVLGVIFQDPLKDKLEKMITADMFVDDVDASFDPGLAVGARFPEIKARLNGREISSLGEFVADKGLVFVAVRSADW